MVGTHVRVHGSSQLLQQEFEAACLHFRQVRQNWGWAITSKAHPLEPPPSSWTYLLQALQFHKPVTPASDQVFNHMDLQRHVIFQPVTLSMAGHACILITQEANSEYHEFPAAQDIK